MRLTILGSAAGGGFPQWNCNYRLSRAARAGTPQMRPRLQSSLAASAGEGRGFVLFNASPDIRQQINETPALQPAPDAPLRSTPIRAVVLTNADVDHLAGLLSLRERQDFHLYATARVLAVLADNPIFRVLDPAHVLRLPVRLDEPFAVEGPDGPTGLCAELFAVPGKVALFLETGEAGRDFEADPEDTVGVRITDAGGRSAFYVPGCARVDPALFERVDGSALLLFDGTVFTDDEMARAGVGSKTGRRMGHLPIADAGGSLEAWAGATIAQRVFVHINNTNPILDEGSAERRIVEDAGWTVAFDGMEIEL
ncbi:pyrroloquinoline quinone biosynthesis protein PqqB [Aureimonas flava]|uniref:Coenzyme PQQ synthesis protein B n=1 Tax=Aureimonas flava TaxID=2320271 RepID=A0A3A1WIB9_9HYPH|nr:pyrroloquinoline quinone biosynthesis protein PqqB [Aureimonas flava]RIY00324.1 pyrroloquinoline quinone biosynthesis protein PqqB [Aureimonas flava]